MKTQQCVEELVKKYKPSVQDWEAFQLSPQDNQEILRALTQEQYNKLLDEKSLFRLRKQQLRESCPDSKMTLEDSQACLRKLLTKYPSQWNSSRILLKWANDQMIQNMFKKHIDKVHPAQALQEALRWVKVKTVYDMTRYGNKDEATEAFQFLQACSSGHQKKRREEWINQNCYNTEDVIAMEDLSEKSPLGLISYRGPSDKKGHCFQVDDLLTSLESNPLYAWTGPENSACCADKSKKYFKLPVGASDQKQVAEWIDEKALARLEKIYEDDLQLTGVHNRNVVLKPVGQQRIGSQFAANAIHGRTVPIYTIE